MKPYNFLSAILRKDNYTVVNNNNNNNVDRFIVEIWGRYGVLTRRKIHFESNFRGTERALFILGEN